jgi:ComF family protein
VCGECLRQPPAFDATIAAVDYAAPLDQLILALKFGGRLALAPLFASMLQSTATATRPLALPARLTAVPLGTRRLMERGFNQALEIARPLSRSLGVTLDAKLVARFRDTRAQAMLHPDERRENMCGAFIVPGDAMERVRGQHIGVVDDVVTTGETLNELAATLKRFGAARVTNFVFAKTPQK